MMTTTTATVLPIDLGTAHAIIRALANAGIPVRDGQSVPYEPASHTIAGMLDRHACPNVMASRLSRLGVLPPDAPLPTAAAVIASVTGSTK